MPNLSSSRLKHVLLRLIQLSFITNTVVALSTFSHINWQDVASSLTLIGDFHTSDITLGDPNALNVALNNPGARVLAVTSNSTGTTYVLGNYPADNYISSVCMLGTVFYFGGRITKIGDMNVSNVFSFDTSTGVINDMRRGLIGTVSQVHCDGRSRSVWFISNTSEILLPAEAFFSSGGRALGNYGSLAHFMDGSWASISGFGLNGAVHGIDVTSSGTLIVGGEFSSTADDGPSDPLSYQVDYSMNVIRRDNDTLDGNALLCNSGTGQNWIVNGSSSYLDFRFSIPITLTAIRLSNLPDNTNGVQLFRLTSPSSSNGIELISVGGGSRCTSCLLSLSGKDETFFLLNPRRTRPVTNLRLEVLSSYGDRAGLAGLTLFQKETLVYANSSFSNSSCVVNRNVTTVISGTWNALDSNSPDLVAQGNPSLNNSIEFNMDVNDAGNYSILFWTPSCSDNTRYSCSSRDTNAVVEIYLGGTASGSLLNGTRVNLAQESPITAYTGYFERGRVAVRIRANHPGQNVAFRALELRKLPSQTFSRPLVTLGSALLSTWSQLEAPFPNNTRVSSLVSTSAGTFIGGTFDISGVSRNVVGYNGSSLLRVSSGGLNGSVFAMEAFGNIIFIGGNFTATADNGLVSRGIVQYDSATQTWQAMGTGLPGFVNHITIDSIQRLVYVRGNFAQVPTGNGSFVATRRGMAIWSIDNNTWRNVAEESWMGPVDIFAPFTTIAAINYVFAGGLSTTNQPFTTQVSHGGAVMLSSSGITPIAPLNDTMDGVTSGSWDMPNGILYVARPFSNGVSESYINAYSVTLKQWHHLDLFPSNVLSVLYVNRTNQLYIGGSFAAVSSSVNGMVTSPGFVVYNTTSGNITGPPTLRNENGLERVRWITPLPDGRLLVHGDFTQAGSTPCLQFCIWDIDASTWINPDFKVNGTANTVFLDGSVLYIGGLMQEMVPGSRNRTVYLFSFDGVTKKVNLLAGDASAGLTLALAGPIESLCVTGSSSSKKIVLAGYSTDSLSNTWLGIWEDNQVVFVTSLSPESIISGCMSVTWNATSATNTVTNGNTNTSAPSLFAQSTASTSEIALYGHIITLAGSTSSGISAALVSLNTDTKEMTSLIPYSGGVMRAVIPMLDSMTSVGYKNTIDGEGTRPFLTSEEASGPKVAPWLIVLIVLLVLGVVGLSVAVWFFVWKRRTRFGGERIKSWSVWTSHRDGCPGLQRDMSESHMPLVLNDPLRMSVVDLSSSTAISPPPFCHENVVVTHSIQPDPFQPPQPVEQRQSPHLLNVTSSNPSSPATSVKSDMIVFPSPPTSTKVVPLLFVTQEAIEKSNSRQSFHLSSSSEVLANKSTLQVPQLRASRSSLASYERARYSVIPVNRPLSTSSYSHLLPTSVPILTQEPISTTLKRMSLTDGASNVAEQQRRLSVSDSGISTNNRTSRRISERSQILAFANQPYQAKDDSELTFHVGDRVLLLDQTDSTWWIGKLTSGKIGVFPASVVTLSQANSSIPQ